MTYLWYCDGASHPLKAKKNGLLQYLTLHDYTQYTPSPHTQNTADNCIDSCFHVIVSHEDSHRTTEDKNLYSTITAEQKKKRKKK